MKCKEIKTLNGLDWEKERTKHIGGSDIAGIANISIYASPLLVYRQKVEGYKIPVNFAMQMGHVLEQTVADMFTVETGIKTRNTGYTDIDLDNDLFMANIDRRLVGVDGILECKTCGDRCADQWEDGKTPEWYYAQVQWYLGVTRVAEAYLACLIGNRKLEIRHILPDPEYIAMLRRCAVEFWENYVIPGIPPEPTDKDLGIVKERTVVENTIPLGAEYEALFTEREALAAQKADLEKQIKAIDAKLIASLEHAAAGECGLWKITCKPETRTTVDSKKLKAEFPDAWEGCKKETVTYPVKVSKKKE